jgi:hypothetical protein
VHTDSLSQVDLETTLRYDRMRAREIDKFFTNWRPH